jgi:hypothetical protein
MERGLLFWGEGSDVHGISGVREGGRRCIKQPKNRPNEQRKISHFPKKVKNLIKNKNLSKKEFPSNLDKNQKMGYFT